MKNPGNHQTLPTLLLLLFLASWFGPLSAAERTYVVQKNDTLSSIAKKHQTTVALLVKQNSLQQPDKIFIGQRLVLPHSGGPTLPPALLQELNRTQVPSKRWKYIVIHHSGTANGNPKGMDRYHREERRMENGLAYHFIIGNGRGMEDGEIAIGQRWRNQFDGGHLASRVLNQSSLGICLVGNFDESRPTEKQMESLEVLTAYLLSRCDLPPAAVRTHQQINTVHTRCPGRYFPAMTFFRNLKK
jgi:LysM repeat protein